MQNLVLLYSSRPSICINATKAGHLDIEFSSTSNITIKSGSISNTLNCDRRFIQIERCADFVVGLMECGKVDIYNVLINEEDQKSKKLSEINVNNPIISIALKKVSTLQTASSCFTFSSAKSLLLFGDLTIVSLSTFQSHRILELVFQSVALNPIHSHILLVSDPNRIAIFDLKAKREIYTSNVVCKSVMWHPTDPLKVIFVSNSGIKYLCLKSGAITDFCDGSMIKYSGSVYVVRNNGLVICDGWKKVQNAKDADFDLRDGMIAIDFSVVKVERFMALNGVKKCIFITRNLIIHKKLYKYTHDCKVKDEVKETDDEKILELIPKPMELKVYLKSLVKTPEYIKLPTSIFEAILSKSDFSLENLTSYEFILLANFLKKQDLLAEKGDIEYWPLLLLTANKNIIDRLEGNIKLAAIAIWDLDNYFEAKTKSIERPESVYDWICFMNKIEIIAAKVKACNARIAGDEYEEYKKYKNITNDLITMNTQSIKSENKSVNSGQNSIMSDKNQNISQSSFNSRFRSPINSFISSTLQTSKNENLNQAKNLIPNLTPSTISNQTTPSFSPRIITTNQETVGKVVTEKSMTETNMPTNIGSRNRSAPNFMPKIPVTQNHSPKIPIPKPSVPFNNQTSSNFNIPGFNKPVLSKNMTPEDGIDKMTLNTPNTTFTNINKSQSSVAMPLPKRNSFIPQPQRNVSSPNLTVSNPTINNNSNKSDENSLSKAPNNTVINNNATNTQDLHKLISERLNHLIETAKTKKGILIQSRVIACIRDVQEIYAIEDSNVLQSIYNILTDSNKSKQYENVSAAISNAISGLRTVCNE